MRGRVTVRKACAATDRLRGGQEPLEMPGVQSAALGGVIILGTGAAHREREHPLRTHRGSMNLSKLGWVLAAAIVAAACDGDNGMDMRSMCDDMGPDRLIMSGQYSDERFINMMAAHHQMAIEMAEVEQQKGTRPELQALAGKMIEDQRREIEELKAIKQARFGSSEVPAEMNHADMENAGMMMPGEMAQQPDVDKEFIDSMMPHHAGAIQMATVALKRSGIEQIRTLSRKIIDAQAEEIGQLIEWRKAWYGSQP
jgi:uncharacterized protein (DUF305 family)